jgi:hypothetical protein
MTQLTWNNPGERYFETGLDRGVFYTDEGIGIAWNGLTSVQETLSGGDAVPYYLDGVKYLNLPNAESFGGTISAYTYPEEFAEYDGSEQMFTGFTINLQRRRPFALSYRTRIGNDFANENVGYKIHIIYNVLVAPSDKTYSTLGDNPSPLDFSWSFTTLPVNIASRQKYTSHIVIDSTKISVGLLRVIEQHLYGGIDRSPMLMPIDKLIYWLESGGEPLEVDPDINGGLADLHETLGSRPRDLVSTDIPGLNLRTYDSRLVDMVGDGVMIPEA